MRFVGREKELAIFNRLRAKKTSSLAVVWGRRRVGKSRLISEFTKDKKTWSFIGIPPSKETTVQKQLDIFTNQMSRTVGMPDLKVSNWGEALWHLGNQAEKEKDLVIVLDEISWIGSKDVNFLGHLKSEWDRTFSKHRNLILILCGSVSNWIEENILSSTGFFGRISLKMELKELPLDDCNEFWRNQKVSDFEKFKILSVTGGIPKYLEEVHPEEDAETNIYHLCFSEEGFLFDEYGSIFSDLFDKRASTFDKIVRLLVQGPKNIDQICEELQIKKGGDISSQLHELITAGFISKDKTWNIKTKKVSTLAKFRLKDNYLRFYLKFIEPNKEKVRQGKFSCSSVDKLLGWDGIIALQFENLVLNNRKKVCELLKRDDVEWAGPYFQKKTTSKRACQIDLLIQTKFSLYICEIKFSKDPIGTSVIEEMEEKINRLKYPKGLSIRPVLVHVNGVRRQVYERDYFSDIIDLGQLLKSSK